MLERYIGIFCPLNYGSRPAAPIRTPSPAFNILVYRQKLGTKNNLLVLRGLAVPQLLQIKIVFIEFSTKLKCYSVVSNTFFVDCNYII